MRFIQQKTTLNVQPQKTHAAKENWSTSLKWLTIMWITFDSSKDCQECNRPDPFDPATKLISSVVDMFPLDPS